MSRIYPSLGDMYSDIYIPTITDVANVASSLITDGEFNYSTDGSIVTVFGVIRIQATVIATETNLRLSLPITSTFATASQLAGCINSASTGGKITANITTNDADIKYTADSTGSLVIMSVNFSYAIS